MKAYVTGGTGFIGGRVVAKLRDRGHEVTCLVRTASNTGKLEELGINLVTGDVTDKKSLLATMSGHDWLFNLANVYSFWEPDVTVYRRINVHGTRHVMEAALELDIPKVIHVSTFGVWGKPAESPITEETPVGPRRFADYFQTKYEGDIIAWGLYESRGLPLTVVYPVGVLGPGDPKTTGKYIQQLVRKKLPARAFEDRMFTFVHVDDVAEAICRVAEREGTTGQKYLIGKERRSFGELNQMIVEIPGVKLPYLKMPDALVIPWARILTLIANIIKKPPMWMMAVDQMRVMKYGAEADGSKAERELGITYRPVQQAVREMIDSLEG